ncbi:MAG: ATP-dependent RecD-like DNA helicase [Simkaniaceae bacterium]|nr:ATP-dependent RecD-like DNA helicase [Simkaniaceae bacterium]
MSEESLAGSVDHIVYSNPENGFTVAHVKNAKEGKVCVVGNFHTLHPGEILSCKGNWKHHPSFGRQFEVSEYQLDAPQDIVGIQKFLESGLIKGIGPVYAERIVAKFGKLTLDVLDKTPDRLKEVGGLGKKRIEQIKDCWDDQREIRKVMIFMRGHGISLTLAQKIYKRYGDDSIRIIQENPYSISRDLFGVGFKTADRIAQSLGLPHDAPERIEAGIEFVLLELSDDGNVCFPFPALVEKAGEVLDVGHDPVKLAIQSLVDERRLVEKDGMIWLKLLYMAETGISQEVERLLASGTALRSVDVGKATKWAEEKLSIEFAEQQAIALEKSLSEKMHIITGGPGTGKSTITRGIISITEKITDKIILAAPTGKAAKRLSQITRRRASTIHSLLEWDFTTGKFKRGRENTLDCDLVIVDEASMIDTHLMVALLKAVPTEARVIFIGDIDQLPSVGPGNVLKDLIASERFAVTTLTQIYRQAWGSRIVTNAHLINKGEFPDLSFEHKSDFIFLGREKPEQILSTVIELITTKLPGRFKFNPIGDIQVLAPMRRGVVGIENLNHTLQRILNPSGEFVERFGRRYQKGDKVMQIRNNNKKRIYNGDVGIIENYSKEEETLLVDFDGKQISYEFSELDELVLAYACSIHKYQGSECPCVVIPIHTSHFKLLYRNLLYTGITRGKRLVVLVGSKKAIAIAIGNDDVRQRHTGLKEFLKR